MKQAFIVDAIRTPFGRYGGALSSVRTDDLGAIPLKALMARAALPTAPRLEPQAVDGAAGHFHGQAGQQAGHAGDVAVVFTGLVGAAEDDVGDGGPVHAGIAAISARSGMAARSSVRTGLSAPP